MSVATTDPLTGEFLGRSKKAALAMSELVFREGLSPCQLLQLLVPVPSPLLHY